MAMIKEIIFNDELPDLLSYYSEEQVKKFKDFAIKLSRPDVVSVEYETHCGCYNDSERTSCIITIEREETKEEKVKRIEEKKKRSIAAKKAAITRKLNKQKEQDRERELYEKLRAKYE